MTPFVADSVSHRTRLAWLAAALAASFAAFAATRPAPAAVPTGRATSLSIGRCHAFTRTVDRDLPAACVAYQERLWKLSMCDQLPVNGRRALRDAFIQTTTTWMKLPRDQRAHLADGCRMGSAALDEATTAMACTYYDRDRILYAGPVDR